MAFDDVAPIYDETRTLPQWVLSEFYKRILGNTIQSNPNLVILDAGVGTGRMLEPLYDLGVHLVGIDISRKMLEKMTKRLGQRFMATRISPLVADVTQLPFRDCTFDIVVAVHLLHLLKNWKQAILETKRVLKPKSSFVVAGHNQPELETKYGRVYLEILLNKAHEHGAPKRVLKRVLRLLGTERAKPAKRILEIVSLYDDWDLYLERHSKSRETQTIRWKERISISTITDRLEKRFASVRTALSTQEYERLMLKLSMWRNDKAQSSLLEIVREFRFVKVQLK